MRHWTENERAAYELAASEAWGAGTNNTDRTDAWLRILRDGEQAHEQWASDVLSESLRDGVWKRLKDERRNQVRYDVPFAGDVASMPGIGGVVRKTENGRHYEQMSFVDMTRDQLLEKQREYEATAFAARRNKHMVKRLIALIDASPEAKTAREAAKRQHIDIDEYLASDAA